MFGRKTYDTIVMVNDETLHSKDYVTGRIEGILTVFSGWRHIVAIQSVVDADVPGKIVGSVIRSETYPILFRLAKKIMGYESSGYPITVHYYDVSY